MSVPYHVAHLGVTGSNAVDEAAVSAAFGAPWRKVSTIELSPGEILGPLDHPDSELLIYVIAGAGTARAAGAEVPLATGSSLAALQGEDLTIEAEGSTSLRLFHVEIGVSDANASGGRE